MKACLALMLCFVGQVSQASVTGNVKIARFIEGAEANKKLKCWHRVNNQWEETTDRLKLRHFGGATGTRTGFVQGYDNSQDLYIVDVEKITEPITRRAMRILVEGRFLKRIAVQAAG